MPYALVQAMVSDMRTIKGWPSLYESNVTKDENLAIELIRLGWRKVDDRPA